MEVAPPWTKVKWTVEYALERQGAFLLQSTVNFTM